MNESTLGDARATRVTPSNFAAVKVLKASAERHNLKSAAHFRSLLCPGMLQACAANTKLTIYLNRSKPTVLVVCLFVFCFKLHRKPLSEPYLAGILGIDQPPSQAASLSAGASAEDDMFCDSASSVTALE